MSRSTTNVFEPVQKNSQHEFTAARFLNITYFNQDDIFLKQYFFITQHSVLMIFLGNHLN